ncbi:MAG: hypothetical protein JOZ08_00900 [Verrucomicrobia bacterium]|nr:hypothetical protein [Verrucomicrobiota bacterium]
MIERAHLRHSYLFLLFSCLIIGCSLHTPQMCDSDVAKENDHQAFQRLLASDFHPEWTDDGGRHTTWACKVPPDDGDVAKAESRPVLLLHEYDHLTTVCLEFAKRLSRAGFRVYVPLLFGKADGVGGTGTMIANTWELETSGEWYTLFAEHKKQPITTWLCDLAKRISEKHGGRRIAVIGMCLTGVMPIAMMGEDAPILAAVVAQPSIPLFAFTPEGERSLGISEDEINNAVKRSKSEHIRIFGTRYEDDTIGKRARFEHICTLFGENFENHTIRACDYLHNPKWGLKSNAHATLTLCYLPSPDDYPPRKLYLELLVFLKAQFEGK